MLKSGENVILPYLKKCFNAIFVSGIFPHEWSKAILIPLQKKGEVNNPDTYRGISFLSVQSQLFTNITNNRLTLWSESNQVLNDAQAGFRKGRSTVDHMFTLHAAVRSLYGL